MASRDPWRRRAAARRTYRRKKGEVIPPPATKRGASLHTQRFVAIDGEGGDRNGEHIYTLLIAGGKNFSEYVHNDGEPLRTKQCLDFILSLPRNRHIISFFFNYDVTMIMRDAPEEVLHSLCDRDSRTNPDTGRTSLVYWDGYGLDWIPGKMFVVTRVSEKGRNVKRTVWDTAGFFQTSLVKALEGWGVGDDADKAFVAAMKSRRSDFTGEVTPEVIRYAHTECVLLCKLMDLVYRESKTLGFELETFSGAGSLANAIMQKWGIDKAKGKLPAEVEDAAYYAYFGGRFEVAAVGEITGPIYEYDINSAYPYAIQSLPNIIDGEWVHNGDLPPDGVALARLRWNIPREVHSAHLAAGALFSVEWGPLPWRNQSGGISYPGSGIGWYHLPEALAALEGPWGKYIQILETWVWRPATDDRPFGQVPDLYARRKLLKREKHLGEKVIKLGLNSLYGKTAQSVGRRRYASIVWAGHITATARAMLADAIHRAGHSQEGVPNVVMTATDAVYSIAPIDLPTGDGLGQWEGQQHKNMLIVQPGLYALNVDTEAAEIRKTRGIRGTAFNASDVLAIWRAEGLSGSFEAPITSFIGLKRGVSSTEYRPGEWVQETRTIGFWPRSKRLPIPIDTSRGTYLATIPASKPGEETMSKRYNPKAMSPELRAFLDFVANDSYHPRAGETVPSVIPGFLTETTEA